MAKRAAAPILPPNDEASLVTRLHPLGSCRHGRALRETCSECERAWYQRRRFRPVKYDDIHAGPQA